VKQKKSAIAAPQKQIKNSPRPNELPVIACTEHRGVFFGYAKKKDIRKTTIELRGARCAIYWCKEVQGVLGLANTGPLEGCRIGARADIWLHKVSAVFMCTEQAMNSWEAAVWSNG
jgi:hypothetical protein